MKNKYILGALGAAVTLVSLHTGCGGGGSSQATLRYPAEELTLTRGQAITPQKPNFVPRGAGFKVTPDLPAGLMLDPTTGVISGTPAAVTAKGTYKVQAGGNTTTLAITVRDLAPAVRFGQVFNLKVGTAVSGLRAESTGGAVDRWSIEPKLPAGLEFNPATGEISGTPTQVSPETEYQVTARNATGETATTLRLAVSASDPVPSPEPLPVPGPVPSPVPGPVPGPVPTPVVPVPVPTPTPIVVPVPAPVRPGTAPAPAPAPAPRNVLPPMPDPAPAPAPDPMPALELRSGAKVVPFGERVQLDWNRPQLDPQALTLRAGLGQELGPVRVGALSRPEVPVRNRTVFTLESPQGGGEMALAEVAARGFDYLAGDFGGRGFGDGHRLGSVWNQPRFVLPAGLARDDRGTTYVVDSGSNTIRRITPSGRVTTLAGDAGQPEGYEDLHGTAARFDRPMGIAVTSDGGVVYVADTGNDAIRMVRPDGTVSTLDLAWAAGAKSLGGEPELTRPTAVALDATGDHLFVADTGHGRILRVALQGAAAGQATVLTLPPGALVAPVALAVGRDARGQEHLYVADGDAQVILDVPTDRPEAARELAGGRGQAGHANGVGALAQFHRPMGLHLVAGRLLIVADAGNNAIRRVDTETGNVTTLFSLPAPADNAGAALNMPFSVTMDGEGFLLVADTGNGVLRRIEVRPGAGPVLRTWAGSLPARAALQDGRGPLARFNMPSAIVVAGNGDAFVVDRLNRVIRRVTPAGEVTTWARPTAAAPFRNLTGLAAAPDGTLFATDHEAGIIVRIGADGAVTRFAGTLRAEGEAAHPVVDGDRLAVARFNGPRGILRRDDGTLFIADGHCLRRIDPNGLVRTVAGHPTESGLVDAPQEAARFNRPSGLALGPDGCVYVADLRNHVIRRVSPDGLEVGTWAGRAGQQGSVDGPDGTATLRRPMALAFGRDGWLHVIGHHTPGVRRIHPRNSSIDTLVEAAGEDLATDHGRLRQDGAVPSMTARMANGWGIAATRDMDLLVTVCDQEGTSGGVMQITEPLAETPDAPGRGDVAWGLDGELDSLFPSDPSELDGEGGEAPHRLVGAGESKVGRLPERLRNRIIGLLHMHGRDLEEDAGEGKRGFRRRGLEEEEADEPLVDLSIRPVGPQGGAPLPESPRGRFVRFMDEPEVVVIRRGDPQAVPSAQNGASPSGPQAVPSAQDGTETPQG